MNIQYVKSGDAKLMVESTAVTFNEPGMAVIHVPKMVKVSPHDLRQIGWMLIDFASRLEDEAAEAADDERSQLVTAAVIEVKNG